jgi:Xaa-Pro aminopeptidase
MSSVYKDFCGIRNGKDILITEDGYRIQGKPKPKSIKEVEALRLLILFFI